MELLYDLWLSLVFQTRTRRAFDLLEEYGSSKHIYENASDIAEDLGRAYAVGDRLRNTDISEAERILEFCERYRIKIVTYYDPAFPQGLLKIKDCPILLYCMGKMPDFGKRLCVAEVGTRKMSDYGASMAYKTAYDLASCGAVVVAGMAQGIDAMAHFGALDAGGDTVAVLGCGFRYAYPGGHRELMATLCKKACVITEYAPSVKPYSYNFPRRNRIISGISDAVCIIEAPTRSGALITADFAEEQNRALFALPGDADRIECVGTNRLIREGASVLCSASDILMEYESTYRATLKIENAKRQTFYRGAAAHKRIEELYKFERNLKNISFLPKKSNVEKLKSDNPVETKSSKVQTAPRADLSDTDRLILSALGGDVLCADQIAEKADIAIPELMQRLTVLEIRGFITAQAGDRFSSNIN